MKPTRRLRAALLRLAPPWRRRHPIHVGGITEADRVRLQVRTTIDAAYKAEQDPAQQAGA